ncbi:MAG: autotransporter assembly complex protein TamA [Pseudomonadota bacterium]
MRPPVRRWLYRCLLALAGPLLAAAAAAQVRVDAPAPLDELLNRHLAPPSAGADDAALDAFARDTRRTVAELLATEGYFSPDIQVQAQGGRLSVAVVPGPRTVVSQVEVDIRGDIAPERRQALLAAWPLKAGAPFRDADWREAKQVLLRRLLAVDYPAARLADSRAEIDPGSAQARLQVAYDTGPRHVFGELEITGLSRYSPELIRRYSRIEPGAPYDEGELLALQAALQRTPYFSSITVEIAQPDTAPETGPVRAPVRVHVRERPPHRLAFGVGYSTNTGARTEVNYQGFDFLHRAWQLDAGVRLEQLRQSLFADVHLPPVDNRRDSFGALAEWEDIQGLRRRRAALGAVRSQVRGSVEARYALNWQRELREPVGAASSTSTALTLDGAWTRRRVDDLVDPRRGYVWRVQAGGGTKALASDQNFLRLHTRYQHFVPVARRDVLSLRGELGATLAPSRAGIPQDFLFRAGGAQSVRGYAYQSLGVKEGNATVGGRYLAVASAEYTHWFDAKWGGAAFIDAGNAGDDRHALSLALGYGAGARWKSPVGPLAVDVAYGERTGKVRLHFSLAVAF